MTVYYVIESAQGRMPRFHIGLSDQQGAIAIGTGVEVLGVRATYLEALEMVGKLEALANATKGDVI